MPGLFHPSGFRDADPMGASVARSDGTRIPVGMLFVPCRVGISHFREKQVEMTDLTKGVEVLEEALRVLAAERSL